MIMMKRGNSIMNDLDFLFKTYISATNGDNKAKWKIVEYYMDYIEFVSDGNDDIKHTIIVTLFDLFDSLNYGFDKFFKEIN